MTVLLESLKQFHGPLKKEISVVRNESKVNNPMLQ